MVDPDVIKVEWLVDGSPAAGFDGELFRPDEAGIAPGDYEITARAYDEVIDFAFTGGPLDLVWTGLSGLEQSVTWRVTITETVPGDFDGDGDAADDDYDLWRSSYGSTTELKADGNNNGVIDAGDYTVWRDNYRPPSTAVPAPASGWLFGWALLVAVAGRPLPP